MTAQPLSPAATGVHRVYVGVSDFGPTVRVFRDALGWQVCDLHEICASDARRVWRVDAPAEVLTLSPARGCPTGAIDLLRFSTLDIPARGAPPMAAFGHMAISLYVRDIEAAVSAVERVGGRLAGSIAKGSVPRGKDGFMDALGARVSVGDFNVLLIETAQPRETWMRARYPDWRSSEINFMLYRTPLLDELLDWWGPAGVGLPIAHSTPIGNESISFTYGAAPGLHQQIGVTANPEPVRLELQGPDNSLGEAPDVASDRRPFQRPGQALGPVLWRVVLPSPPESFSAWAGSRGLQVRERPRRLVSEHFQGRRIGIVTGPGDFDVQLEVPL